MRLWACYGSAEYGVWWFRIFGYGFALRDIRRDGMTFSERYGLVQFVKIGPWIIRFLTPYHARGKR